VRSLVASRIRELYNEGVGRSDILPFWVGEPDEPTPDFIRRAGIASIEAGEMFYSHNFGIPELREALASYLGSLHSRKIDGGRLAITSAGVNALMLASQLILDPGDKVVEVVPIAALTQGEPLIRRTRERFRKCRDFLVGEMQGMEKVKVANPSGTMYAFLKIEGVTDSLAFCKRLVREQGLGLAPGSAFGPEGEGYVRWCFAAGEDRLAEGVRRLRRALPG